MPAAKYDGIYNKLREQIVTQKYPAGSFLPSEHQLTQVYDCSRNTVRRAIRQLSEEGYVQSIHGKGVRVIYWQALQTQLFMSGIESLKETAERNGASLHTKVIRFEEVKIDEKLAEMTGFDIGDEVYDVQRVRYLNEEATILDHSYYLKRAVPGLTEQIAEESVYEYMEKTLGETILMTRRKYTAERETDLDTKYLDLHGYNCLLVITDQTFTKEGVMFAYTHSRYRLDRFVFYKLIRRK